MVTHIKRTPIRILNNGFGQAIAFLLAENEGKKNKFGGYEKPSGQLYDWLQDWLCGAKTEKYPCRVYSSINLMQQLIDHDRHYYMQAHREALILFDWMKKFADAKLNIGEEHVISP